MAEKTNEKKIHKHHISPEAREHFRATRQEMHKSLEGILPPEFKDHLRKAHREMLLGWRSMIDTVLQRMGNPEKKN